MKYKLIIGFGAIVVFLLATSLFTTDFSGVTTAYFKSIENIVNYSTDKKLIFTIDTTFKDTYWGENCIDESCMSCKRKVLSLPIRKFNDKISVIIQFGNTKIYYKRTNKPFDYTISLFKREDYRLFVYYVLVTECGLDCGSMYKYYFLNVLGREVFLFKKYARSV